MHRWTDGSLAKHLSNLQVRHYEDDDTPARDGEVKVLLSSIWPEADVVEGLTLMLRSLVDVIENAALKGHPCYQTVDATAQLASQVLETAEHWSGQPVPLVALPCTSCGGTGRFIVNQQALVCRQCKGLGQQ